MKKKLLTLVLAAACTFSFTACSSMESLLEAAQQATEETEASEEITESTEEETEQSTKEATEESTEEATEATEETTSAPASVNTPSELSDDLYSFQVSVDGTVYQFPMWYSDFEALGWTYNGDATATLTSNQYTVAEMWEKDGCKISSKIANLSMNTAPYSNCIVAGITFDPIYLKDCDWEIILPKGIQYGVSTTDDIIAAYGTPSSDYDGSMYYKMSYEYGSYQSIELYVYKESGVLEQIEIENIIELEGADNSVDSTVPEIVKNYTAPTAVGDDLYAFNIELEGNLYTLPCPVSELLANGFTINEKDSASEFAAGGFDWVEFKYNNQTYRTLVHNYADYATTVENCFVTSMKSSIYDPDFALTIPCDIKRGDNEKEVLEILKKYNYEIETSSDFTYYTVYDPDGSKLDNFTIITKEGEVVIIEVSNSNKPEY